MSKIVNKVHYTVQPIKRGNRILAWGVYRWEGLAYTLVDEYKISRDGYSPKKAKQRAQRSLEIFQEGE